MNSLNIISARVSPPASPVPSRSNSLGAIGLATISSAAAAETGAEEDAAAAAHDEENDAQHVVEAQTKKLTAEPDEESRPDPTTLQQRNKHRDANESLAQPPTPAATAEDDDDDETAPLLTSAAPFSKEMGVRSSGWHQWPRQLASATIDGLRWMLTTFVTGPGYYLIAWLYDDAGNFVPLVPLRRLFGGGRRAGGGGGRKLVVDYGSDDAEDNMSEKQPGRSYGTFAPTTGSSVSGGGGLTSESDSELEAKDQDGGGSNGSGGSTARHARSKSSAGEGGEPTTRRSIRIKLHSEDSAGRPRKQHRKAQSASAAAASAPSSSSPSSSATASGLKADDISAQLKSPTSPAGALTKYPKTPAPPRPLIPRRQPSYINLLEPKTDGGLGLLGAGGAHHHPHQQKTLILDLDETLIHSMSKGGTRGAGSSSGHMVEVRLNTTYVGVAAGGGQSSAVIGPQHPILYYVHKRPHCDHFLRRVCKWYNLVVFTASVQEYADPVIDWLESERKFFSARFYRQHCTFRHGAFIKDLSSVEPDLSKVVILDNSPLSYLFHQDNAIPIQGWINDPTDNDLLHLVPFLEGLQYVSDVRALLALRGGEDGQHMA